VRCAALVALLCAVLACGSTPEGQDAARETDAEAWERLYQSGERWSESNMDASVLYHERALRKARRSFPPGDARRARSELALGEMRRRQGLIEEATELLEAGVARARALEPEDPELLAEGLQSLGLLAVMMGDLPAAEAALVEAVRLRLERLDARTPESAETVVQLAEAQRRLGKHGPAERNLIEAAGLYTALGPDYAIRIATIQNNLGLLYQETGRYEDAERQHREAIRSARQEPNPHNPNTAIYSRGLGDLYVRLGRLEGAEELYRYALGVLVATVGENNVETKLTRRRLDNVRARLGRPEAPGQETFR
jgi:tetratricopeptide (TPR) repeat protein